MTNQTKGAPEELEVTREALERVEANEFVMRQAGARSVQAETVSVRQGGVVRVDAEQVDMLGGGVVLAQTDGMRLTASKAGLVNATGPVTMDQSGAGVILGLDEVAMDQCGTVLLVAPEVHADEANAVFLLARRVVGQVNAVFGPRESLLLGAAAGTAAGLVFLLTRRLQGR